jgi:hypothetical protein
VVLLTAGATLLNPNGLADALYPFSYLGNNASMRYIAEWVSPDFHQPQYLLFEAMVLLLLVGGLAGNRRARLADILVLLPFTYQPLRGDCRAGDRRTARRIPPCAMAGSRATTGPALARDREPGGQSGHSPGHRRPVRAGACYPGRAGSGGTADLSGRRGGVHPHPLRAEQRL